jgi:hypothetical protein
MQGLIHYFRALDRMPMHTNAPPGIDLALAYL